MYAPQTKPNTFSKQHYMQYQELLTEFTKKFKANRNQLNSKGIGIEMELPLVSQTGEAIKISVVEKMFEYLRTKGFHLKKTDSSNLITSAVKVNKKSAEKFTYHLDTVMTDVGYSTLEVILAPQDNLHLLQQSLSELMNLLVAYFDTQDCKILGYGIQPITPPSRKLLMPKERYLFIENFSPNRYIPKKEGVDAHLLTITASNQCHIDIEQNEMINAVNVLNALSGIHIILHANSPIWKGNIQAKYKAYREVFWQYCYPDRTKQMGIPPKFRDTNHYLKYLLSFKTMLIERKKLIQITNKSSYHSFMLNKSPAIGKTLEGDEVIIQPKTADLHYLNSFCYFNARLVPKLGTIESRMCCQQPPNASLAPTAMTLGILSNLEEAKKLMDAHPWEIWKQIRLGALQHTFKSKIEGKSILPLVSKVLEVAKEGLLKRNLGEEEFLKPLYLRLATQSSPADEAIRIFKKEGMDGFLNHYAFTTTAEVST